MVTNCINCGAPIDRKQDKCPYCDTPYEYSGFDADLDKIYGKITIAGKTYNVYLSESEVHEIMIESYRDRNGILKRTYEGMKRKFVLIEV